MSSMRKLAVNEQTAYEKMTAARADLIAALAEHDGRLLCGSIAAATMTEREDAQLARLRRRVGAYTAQWEAAARRVETAQAAREVGQ